MAQRAAAMANVAEEAGVSAYILACDSFLLHLYMPDTPMRFCANA